MATKPAVSEHESLTVKAANEFALDLYKQVGNVEENCFISPISITLALAMTCAGARGKTSEEMKQVMKLAATELSDENIHASFGRLQGLLIDCGVNCTVHLANRLFAQKDYNFLDEFKQLTMKHYNSEMSLVDYVNQVEDARQNINSWVEEQTQNKIKDIIAPGVLNALTRLVLVNAIYFKGNWISTFDKNLTGKQNFNINSNNRVSIDMMYKKDTFRYGENESLKVKALELLYEGGNLSMVILLPDAIDGLQDLIQNLDYTQLSDPGKYFSMLPRNDVNVHLPRFKMEYFSSLTTVLQNLGMAEMFSPGVADFSGMDASKELSVSDVVHKTFVEVNEEGTEAAAATAVMMMLCSAPMPVPELFFRADHPFLFFIRDRVNGTVLFLGHYSVPQ